MVAFTRVRSGVNLQKKTIYICIELKSRELNTAILLASKAVLEGYRVYFGSHAAIFTLMKSLSNRNGILLEKSTQPEWLLKEYLQHFEHIVVMDVELSPVINKNFSDAMVANRLYPGSVPYISQFICLSPQIRAAAERLLCPTQVKLNGWVKSELWSNYASKIYDREVQRIKSKHKEYLLFASGFRYLENPLDREKYQGPGVIVQNEKNTLEYKIRNHENFLNALRILKIWDENPKVPKILVRPHPSEDVRVWEKALLKFNKTSITQGNEIEPWILASSGVIHAGSTVTIEAALAGKELYFLKSCSILERHELSEKMSQYIVNEATLPNPLDTKKLKNEEFDQELLESMSMKDETPTSSLLEKFFNLQVTPSNRASRRNFTFQVVKYRSIRRALGLAKHEISWKMRKTNLPPQSMNIPRGIRRKDIRKVLNSDPSFRNIPIRHIGINLWEFDALDS